MNCASKANDFDLPRLCFVLEKMTPLLVFFPLFQRGVTVRGHVGCSIKSFLVEEMGADAETIEKIQSIFLDGSPVDDLDSSMVRDGSSLALSAAMPGLVGATMRRGGAYASFRSTITYKETSAECVSGEGFIRVKLFNLLLNALGPRLLGKGVLVKASDLIDILTELPQDFKQGCLQVLFNGVPVGAGDLHSRLLKQERVCLSITTQGAGR